MCFAALASAAVEVRTDIHCLCQNCSSELREAVVLAAAVHHRALERGRPDIVSGTQAVFPRDARRRSFSRLLSPAVDVRASSGRSGSFRGLSVPVRDTRVRSVIASVCAARIVPGVLGVFRQGLCASTVSSLVWELIFGYVLSKCSEEYVRACSIFCERELLFYCPVG